MTRLATNGPVYDRRAAAGPPRIEVWFPGPDNGWLLVEAVHNAPISIVLLPAGTDPRPTGLVVRGPSSDASLGWLLARIRWPDFWRSAYLGRGGQHDRGFLRPLATPDAGGDLCRPRWPGADLELICELTTPSGVDRCTVTIREGATVTVSWSPADVAVGMPRASYAGTAWLLDAYLAGASATQQLMLGGHIDTDIFTVATTSGVFEGPWTHHAWHTRYVDLAEIHALERLLALAKIRDWLDEVEAGGAEPWDTSPVAGTGSLVTPVPAPTAEGTDHLGRLLVAGSEMPRIEH